MRRVLRRRFSFMAHLGGFPDLSKVRSVIDLVRPYDWHIAVHGAGQGLVDMEDLSARIEARVVIDHMGRPDLARARRVLPMRRLRRLLDTGKIWVKLSGADRLSKESALHAMPSHRPQHGRHAPERILWGVRLAACEPAWPDDGRRLPGRPDPGDRALGVRPATHAGRQPGRVLPLRLKLRKEDRR